MAPTKTCLRYLEPWDGQTPRQGEKLPATDPRSPEHWLDVAFAKSFSESIIRPFADRYFRAEVSGIDNIPSARGAVIAMNHSGMGWPWDAVVFVHRVLAMRGYAREWMVRGFALPYFFTMPGLGPLVLRTGFYPASYQNLDRLLGEGELVLYFPEGVGGIGKGWKKRYQTQTFHTSFVKTAAKWGAPLIPSVCLGGEELNPLATNIEGLARMTGLPIFPLSPLQLALFPTWLSAALFVLPSRLRYHVGEPLRVNLDPKTATEDDYRAAAEELRVVMQGMIDTHKDEPAQNQPPPPEDPNAWRYPWAAMDHALAVMPFGWGALYMRFWNAYHEAHGAPASDKPQYAPHPLTDAEQTAFLVPWAWLWPLAKHGRNLLDDRLGIAEAFGIKTKGKKETK